MPFTGAEMSAQPAAAAVYGVPPPSAATSRTVNHYSSIASVYIPSVRADGGNVIITSAIGCMPAKVIVAPTINKATTLAVMKYAQRAPPCKTPDDVSYAVEVDAEGRELEGGSMTKLFYERDGATNTFWNLYGVMTLEYPVPVHDENNKWDGKTMGNGYSINRLHHSASSNAGLLSDVKDRYTFLGAELNRAVAKQRAEFLELARDCVRALSSSGWVLPDDQLKLSTELKFAKQIRPEDASVLIKFVGGGTRSHTLSQAMKLPDQPTKFVVRVQSFGARASRALTVTARWPWAQECYEYFRTLVSGEIGHDNWFYLNIELAA